MKDTIYAADDIGTISFEFDTAVAEVFPDMLRRSIPGYAAVGIVPDQGDDIYVLMQWAGSTVIDRNGPAPDDFIALLSGGENPATVAYTFPSALSVIDMKVRPRGTNRGNVVVMVDDTVGGGSLFVELE